MSIVVWQFGVPLLAGAVLVFALILGWQNPDAVQLFSIVFYTLVTWSGFLFGVALNVIVRLLRRLPENNFGLCNGSFPDQLETTANIPWWEQQRLQDKEDAPTVLPLTHWLDEYFNKLAYGENPDADRFSSQELPTFGAAQKKLIKDHRSTAGQCEPKHCPPITFRDLIKHDIHLHLKATNLSQQIASSIPFADNGLFYRRDEFEQLFPKNVIAYLDDFEEKFPTLEKFTRQGYRRLPLGEALPIIIGVRMSLSFPILLSAIKLYKETASACVLIPCWFTDGGITSNFPVSLFDDPLPACPTFAIDLIPPNDPVLFSLPDNETPPDPLWWYKEGHTPTVSQRSLASVLGWQPGLSQLLGFVSALFDTARNWRDNSYVILPGYRDRVARVHVPSSAGGLNLAMPPESILELSNRGEAAAQELTRRFAIDSTHPMNWQHHQRMRFRSFMASFDDLATEYCEKYSSGGYKDSIQNRPDDFSWNDSQQSLALTNLERLMDTFDKWPKQESPFLHQAPMPNTTLRSRPKE